MLLSPRQDGPLPIQITMKALEDCDRLAAQAGCFEADGLIHFTRRCRQASFLDDIMIS